MNNFKNQIDLVGILLKFINNCKSSSLRDIASHIMVLIIDSEKYEKVAQHAKDFLNVLTLNYRRANRLGEGSQ